jgi:hypothetical protein
MNYFDDMRDKYGFNDGGAVPNDAGACRTVYVTTINKLAVANGSAFRAYAYDRGGVHNWCLIFFAKLEDITAAKIPIEKLIDDSSCGKLKNDESYDEAMEIALEQAHDLGVDQYVESKVTIDTKGLVKALTKATKPRKARRK